MKNYTKELLIEKLSVTEFPDYSTFDGVNGAYSDFLTRFMYAIDSISPVKQVRIKTNTKPWFDGIVLEAIRVRDKLRKKYKKSLNHKELNIVHLMQDLKKVVDSV